MRLSDAMATGRVTITDWQTGNLTGCILGAACNAVGIVSRDEPHTYSLLYQQWPWLHMTNPEHAGTDCMYAIYRKFDWDVMKEKSMTLDQLIDWVRSVEPQEEPVCSNCSGEYENPNETTPEPEESTPAQKHIENATQRMERNSWRRANQDSALLLDALRKNGDAKL